MVNKELVQNKIEALEGTKEEFVPIEQVRELTNAIKSLFEGNFEEVNIELYGELGELARFINNAKKELQETVSKVMNLIVN